MDETLVGAYDAKTHLPQLLERVQRGASVTITKHGRPVAKIVPVSATSLDPDEIIAALREARVGVRRGTDCVREMIEEGRR